MPSISGDDAANATADIAKLSPTVRVIGAVIAAVALYMGGAGAPWYSREAGGMLSTKLDNAEKALAAEMSERRAEGRAAYDRLQRAEYDLQWLKERVIKLEEYTYPTPSGRSVRPPR